MKWQSRLFIVVVFLIMGCGGGFKSVEKKEQSSSGPDVEVVGDIQITGAVADGIAQAMITVKIVNQRNEPVSGITPRIFEDGSFTIVTACSASNAMGESICGISSTRAGSRALNVVFPSEFSGVVAFTAGPPTKLLVIAGDNQTAQAGSNVLIEPQVRITDQFDNPIAGLPVTFTPSTGGAVGTSPANTDQFGQVGSGSWTLSATPGANTLTVVHAGLSVVINATGLTNDPQRLVHFPAGACSTGELEVYIDTTPHPNFQFITAEDCIELTESVAATNLRVRCIDSTGAALPSAFVGPATENLTKDSSVCRQIHRS